MRNVQLAEICRKAPGYLRYMDDLAVWSDSKAWLWALADDLAERVASTRSLELKGERTLVAPCSVGVPFLGYRIFPGLIRHQGPRARRRRRLFRELKRPLFPRGEVEGAGTARKETVPSIDSRVPARPEPKPDRPGRPVGRTPTVAPDGFLK